MNEYVFNEINIGQKESFSSKITEEMEDAFRSITGDINPLHNDNEYAIHVGGGKFPSHVTFGMLSASLISTLAGVYLPGKYSLIHSIEIGFISPVFAGNELTVLGEVIDKQDGLNVIIVKVTVTNQDNKTVIKGKLKVLVLK